ncbi:hypothetical protein RSO01_89810 [Reyranella soli]|jgi:hypothetical protein|uniref:Uncharacterized protein n=1 Tax=Reyranella soli TaxID=1230389 RepID=A0A512NS93_9HYPH|nr:hypothetical protein RSO01_89810 [Reyranella soli]
MEVRSPIFRRGRCDTGNSRPMEANGQQQHCPPALQRARVPHTASNAGARLRTSEDVTVHYGRSLAFNMLIGDKSEAQTGAD